MSIKNIFLNIASVALIFSAVTTAADEKKIEPMGKYTETIIDLEGDTEKPGDHARHIENSDLETAVDTTTDNNRAKVLIVTGIDHPGHLWKETSPVLKKALAEDKRLSIDIVEDPEYLATEKLGQYDTIVLHFMNWKKPNPGKKTLSGRSICLSGWLCDLGSRLSGSQFRC